MTRPRWKAEDLDKARPEYSSHTTCEACGEKIGTDPDEPWFMSADGVYHPSSTNFSGQSYRESPAWKARVHDGRDWCVRALRRRIEKLEAILGTITFATVGGAGPTGEE